MNEDVYFLKIRQGYVSDSDDEFYMEVYDASDGKPKASAHKSMSGNPKDDALLIAKTLVKSLNALSNN